MRSPGTKQVKNRIIQNANEMNQNNREQLNHENRLTKLFEDFQDFKDLYSCYPRSIGPKLYVPRDTISVTT